MSESIFGKSITQLQAIAELDKWSKREPLDHRKLNQPVAAINRMVRGLRGPRQLGGRPAPEDGTVPALFRFKELRQDYMLARKYDSLEDVDGVEYVAIALPWLLRKTPFDGQQRNGIQYDYGATLDLRVATRLDNQATEVQVITVAYVEGDFILAFDSVDGGTGVKREVDGEQVAVTWYEQENNRAWARKFIQP